MIRIALYDKNAEESRGLRRIVGSYARRKGFHSLSIRVVNSYGSFIDTVKKMEPGFFDMALIRVSETGDDVIDKLANLLSLFEELSPQTGVVVLSDNPSHAYNAYEVGAKYLRTPFDEHDFSNTIGASLHHSAAVTKRPFSIKSGKSVMVMSLNDIMFAEANKRGPIIHLPNDRTVPVKGTLHALYDKLNALGNQFFRAGGSFIVNLDNVRSADDNSVIFANGETVILPVRSRKPVLDAFKSWRIREG